MGFTHNSFIVHHFEDGGAQPSPTDGKAHRGISTFQK